MTRTQQLAVTVTCLVAALTYAGAVTTWALALFVLPGVAGAALLAWPFVERGFPGTTIVVVGLLVLGWAELANIWTGQLNGPAARSTLFAGGWTVIAVVFAQSRWPALFLAAVAGLVLGALVLGAAGEVELVVVAAALCAALTLGSIERSRRRWTAGPWRGAALLLLSLLAAAAAAGVVLLQAQHDPRHPYLLAQGKKHQGIKPAFSDPLSKESNSLNRSAHQRPNKTASGGSNPPPHRPHARRPHSPPTHTQRPHHSTHPQQQHATRPPHPQVGSHAPRSKTWLYVLAGILLFLLVIAALIGARLLATRLKWRRLRRRLAAGSPADQVTGAWAWMRLRLEACRLPLAIAVSPDILAAGRSGDGLPEQLLAPLQALATATTGAAFASAQSLGAADVTAAWTAAGRADASARELLTRRGRTRLAFRNPASAARPNDEVTSRRLTARRGAIVAVSGLILAFAILLGVRAFENGKSAAAPVSTPTRPAATGSISSPTVTAPTTPHHAPVTPMKAPSQQLAPGDTGSQVKLLQHALAALGFSTGTPDGSYGPATQAAVERFQAAEGLPQIGVVGPQTLAALHHALSRRSRR